jgi:hypothetical protein
MILRIAVTLVASNVPGGADRSAAWRAVAGSPHGDQRGVPSDPGRGGLSAKIRLVTAWRCRPIVRLTSPGQHGDSLRASLAPMRPRRTQRWWYRAISSTTAAARRRPGGGLAPARWRWGHGGDVGQRGGELAPHPPDIPPLGTDTRPTAGRPRHETADPAGRDCTVRIAARASSTISNGTSWVSSPI